MVSSFEIYESEGGVVTAKRRRTILPFRTEIPTGLAWVAVWERADSLSAHQSNVSSEQQQRSNHCEHLVERSLRRRVVIPAGLADTDIVGYGLKRIVTSLKLLTPRTEGELA